MLMDDERDVIVIVIVERVMGAAHRSLGVCPGAVALFLRTRVSPDVTAAVSRKHESLT
jgi:hypothetical protein